jgi:hypothetical protein
MGSKSCDGVAAVPTTGGRQPQQTTSPVLGLSERHGMLIPTNH